MKKSIVAVALLSALAANAIAFEQSHNHTFTDFEYFATGAVNGQYNWQATGDYDHEVIDLNNYPALDGLRDQLSDYAFRISNHKISGSFGDMPSAAPSLLSAGESRSINARTGDGAAVKHFVASFDIASLTGSEQPGLKLTVSPDNGIGARQSYVQILDDADGFTVATYDTILGEDGSLGWAYETLVTGLSHAEVHNIKFVMTFNQGFDTTMLDIGGVPTEYKLPNDVAEIYVNDELVHTGTSWELYYLADAEYKGIDYVPQAISTLLFQTRGTKGLDDIPNAGGGFVIDNVYVSTPYTLEVPEPPKDGEDGTSCTVEPTLDGGAVISCDDGSEVIIDPPQDGQDGQDGVNGVPGTDCTIKETDTGAEITCGDDTVTISNGATGPQGQTGAGSAGLFGLLGLGAIGLYRNRKMKK